MTKYKDFNLAFTAHPVTGDIAMIEDNVSVTAALRNLILMAHYEKPFHPEIGCSVKKLLFEFISPMTAIHIKNIIMDVINNFESRAKVYKLDVIPDYIEQGYNIQIWFYILDRAEKIEITLPLRRLR